MDTKSKNRQGKPTASSVRAARRERRGRRRRILRFSAFLVVGVVAFLLIVSLFAGSLPISIGGTGKGGVGIKVEEQGKMSDGSIEHVDLDADHPPYNSVPATSGWHYGQPLAPVRWAVYDEFISDEYLVHNLEHGGVAVHYDCPEDCPEVVDGLESVVNRALEEGMKVLMSPYPDMETMIVLTAWTYMEKLDAFDKDRINDFIVAHESSPNAPEWFAR